MSKGMEKVTKGRQKVEIKGIKEENKRQVTFSKRKLGLFNKAAELNVLTGAEVVAIVFSKHQKLYSFVTPGSKYLLNWSTSTTATSTTSEGPTAVNNNTNYYNYGPQKLGHGYYDLEAEVNLLEERRERVKNMIDLEADEIINGGKEGFWWDRPIENMDFEEAKRFKEALQMFKVMVEKKALG